MSASGPFGPSFFGVWQSWQPPPITSIFPRSAGVCAGAAAAVGGAGCAAGGWLQAAIAIAAGRTAASAATRWWETRMNITSARNIVIARRHDAGGKSDGQFTAFNHGGTKEHRE